MPLKRFQVPSHRSAAARRVPVSADVQDREAGEFCRAYARLPAGCKACRVSVSVSVSVRYAFARITVPDTALMPIRTCGC
jgi:hypothetical protein